MKFGSALATENKDNEIVCIPGLKGRDPKEISLRNLSQIIQARMDEIIDHVYYEIRNSGLEKKLIGGIVLTGGGALLKGLDERLRKETGMPIHVAERPLDAVVEGSGKCIEEFEALEKVLISEPRR